MNDDLSALAGFAGTARLFPLPNVVFFPHVVLPLHVFEPRYRQMTAEALAGDRLIGMALLRAGWEADYEGRPPLHETVCLGHVTAEQRLPDGRYNMLLRGLAQARIVEELPPDKLYRSARVELLEDVPVASETVAGELRGDVEQLVGRWFQAMGVGADQLQKLLRGDLSLGAIGDVLSFALPLAVEFKQELLDEVSVERRVRRLIEVLESSVPQGPAGDKAFPPEFSSN